jgi:quinol monooxygenase YgiN
MVIVGGTFELEPSQRDAFLASRHNMMTTSRGEAGCLEYTFAADPIDPSRVILFERWENQAALDAHLTAVRANAQPSDTEVVPITSSITFYDVSGERKLGR